MRTIAGQFILALALFVAGIACWMEARLAHRLAEAHERLATVHYDTEDGIDETMTVVNRLPWPGGSLGADIGRHRATVSICAKIRPPQDAMRNYLGQRKRIADADRSARANGS